MPSAERIAIEIPYEITTVFLWDLYTKDERGAHLAEHVTAHHDYIQLVDKIQDLVDEYDADDDGSIIFYCKD